MFLAAAPLNGFKISYDGRGTMQKLTINDILSATGGKLVCGSADTELSEITTDSRRAAEGVLFIPLAGE